MSFEIVESYPLTWPTGWRRVQYTRSAPYRNNWTIAIVLKLIKGEVRLLGGLKVIISSNLKLKNDGFPYLNQVQPDDRGVALYFTLKNKQVCFACDKWNKVEHNMRAIAMAISALRQLERCGSSEILERAFTGYTALPNLENWWEVLGVDLFASNEDVKKVFRDLCKKYHPDVGGEHSMFVRITNAFDQFKSEREL